MASDALSNDLGNGASGLPKGTVVHAKMGRLPIEDVCVGDEVWSTVPGEAGQQLRHVIAIHRNESCSIEPFGFAAAGQEAEQFTYLAASDQEFWVPGKDWQIPGNLSHEDRLELIGGRSGVAWGEGLFDAWATNRPGVAWIPLYRGADQGEYVDLSGRSVRYWSMEEAAAAGIRTVWASQFRWHTYALTIEDGSPFYAYDHGILVRSA